MHLLPKQELGKQQSVIAVVKTSVIMMKMMMMVAMMSLKIHVFIKNLQIFPLRLRLWLLKPTKADVHDKVEDTEEEKRGEPRGGEGVDRLVDDQEP